MSVSRVSSQAPGKLRMQKIQALRQNLEWKKIPLPPFLCQGHYSSSLALVIEHLLTEVSRLMENNPNKPF